MSPTEPNVSREAPTPPDAAAVGANGLPPVLAAERNGSPTTLLSEAEFTHKNNRRIDLIRKNYRQGLTAEEKSELEQLDAEVDAYLDARFPRPIAYREQMMERARKLGFVP